MQASSLPVIAIVGRPNVGKSALFNAILHRRLSIVHEQSGVTRDNVAAETSYNGRHFLLVDTGGLGTINGAKKVDLFDGMIRDQVTDVVKDAAALVWVVNCQDGITPQDEEVGAFFRKTGKPLILVANKADNAELEMSAAASFAKLGVKTIFPTSCTHTYGVDKLLKHLTAAMPEAAEADAEAEKPLRIAVVGRPNVGKSSTVNRLTGQARMMVSDVAGTTRDAVDMPVTLHSGEQSLDVILVDTAGLRRPGQISTVVEFFSANRTEQAIRSCDLVLFVIDAVEPCTTQERRIGRIITDAHKPCILLANKWDLVIKEEHADIKRFTEFVRNAMPFIAHAPVLPISAANGFNAGRIIELIQLVKSQMQIMVPTGVFNQFLQDIMQRNPPTSSGLKRFKIFYGTMVHNPPPKFVLFVNDKKLCPKNYLAFLENQLREAFFPQAGLPIMLDLRERSNPDGAIGARAAAMGSNRAKFFARNKGGFASRKRGSR